MRHAITLSLLLLVLACKSEQTPPVAHPEAPASHSTVLAKYHVVTWSEAKQQMVGLVRAITPSTQTQAPVLTVNQSPIPANIRSNPDSSAFPITVWEWEIGIGQQAFLEGAPLPVVTRTPNTILVVGDTGALSDQNTASGDWPFGPMMHHLSKAQPLPDLAVHVGDYNYRGTPHHSPTAESPGVYDACGTDYQRQDTTGMAWGDDWKTWEADFFDPAKPLLESVPWVLARGNHELCSRAGTGWYYLLDPGSTLLDPNYNDQPCANANTFTAQPYALTFSNLQLIMVDSANLCDTSRDDNEVATYTPVFQSALALARANNQIPSWMVTHRPYYSFHKVISPAESAEATPECSTYICQTMDAVLEQASFQNWHQAFPIWLAGHVHNFQFLKPTPPGWPSHFVVGNSGVTLSDPGANGPVHATFTLGTNQQLPVTGSAYHQFGYLLLASSSATWQAHLHAPDGTPIAQFTP